MTDFDTICNEVQKKKRTYRPMSPEIVLTSSFYFDDFNEYAEATSNEFEHYVYTRGTNPTTELLEEKLAKMSVVRCLLPEWGLLVQPFLPC